MVDQPGDDLLGLGSSPESGIPTRWPSADWPALSRRLVHWMALIP
ncbi:MAG TPA: hypothetical protein VIZ43_24700 [Trebonia sp.]